VCGSGGCGGVVVWLWGWGGVCGGGGEVGCVVGGGVVVWGVGGLPLRSNIPRSALWTVRLWTPTIYILKIT
jgi:hypothetical protein